METEAVETSTATAGGGTSSVVATPVAEQAPATMLEENNKKEMKVMVAVDESEESFYALKWALDHLFPPAAGPAGATPKMGTVTVLHVLEPFQPYVLPAGPAVFATTTMVESVRKAQEENAAVILTRALKMCKQKMIKAETLILQGEPKDMICQAAEQIHADLVVVGSRGLGKIKRALLGSVSDYCAHHVKWPILIVKPPKHNSHHK